MHICTNQKKNEETHHCCFNDINSEDFFCVLKMSWLDSYIFYLTVLGHFLLLQNCKTCKTFYNFELFFGQNRLLICENCKTVRTFSF